MVTRIASTAPVRLGSTTDDYSRIGIEPRAIKQWEDGMRTDGSRGGGEQLTETDNTLWELMYFGKAHSQTQADRSGEL